MALRSKFLPLTIIALLLVTACSQQKFAFRKKVPVDHEATVMKKAGKNLAEDVNVASEEAAVTAEAAATAPAAKNETDFVKKQDELHKAPVVSPKTKSPKALEKMALKQAVKKLADKKENLDVSASSINPRQFIIIGLIILLIGVVLSIVLSGLGYLVAVVGVVFIVIGLIVMLAGNL